MRLKEKKILKKFAATQKKFSAQGAKKVEYGIHVYEQIFFLQDLYIDSQFMWPGRVAQSVGHLTRKSGVLGSIPGLAT